MQTELIQSRFGRTSYQATRQQVFDVPTPESTLTHKPIHHSQLLSETEELINEITDLTITNETHILSKKRSKDKDTGDIITIKSNEYIGLLELNNSDIDKTYQVMLLNSHNKIRAATLMLYKTLKICENGMLLIIGQENVHKRMHTRHIQGDIDNNLTNTITDFVSEIEGNIKYDDDVIKYLQCETLSEETKDHFIMQSIRDDTINLTRAKYVDEEYYDPSTIHPGINNSPYQLLMAYTHVLKDVETFRRIKLLTKLNRQFNEMLIPDNILQIVNEGSY